jgi:hypothetical protein
VKDAFLGQCFQSRTSVNCSPNDLDQIIQIGCIQQYNDDIGISSLCFFFQRWHDFPRGSIDLNLDGVNRSILSATF